MKSSVRNILSVCTLAITLFACGSPAQTATLPTILPPTNPPMVEPLTLKSSPFSDEGQAPNYKITAQIPYLDPSTDPSVLAYNAALKAIVDGEIAAFKGTLAEMSATPILNGSSLDIQYQLIGQKGSIWSIQFNIMGFADGAAHPYHYSGTVNYDLDKGKDIILDEIFLPNSNYLQFISQYCVAELSKRDIGFDGFHQGADPTAENYRNWNVSDKGLVITFDEYQVAPYAAGPQTVIIPYGVLGSLINDQSPLAPFLP